MNIESISCEVSKEMQDYNNDMEYFKNKLMWAMGIPKDALEHKHKIYDNGIDIYERHFANWLRNIIS